MPTVFVTVSLVLVYLSRSSLLHGHSHGFFRFFAFEAVLALLVLNAGRWFADRFSPAQIASWVLLAGSVLLAVHGFYILKKAGKPEAGIEDTTDLVQRGAYRYIRHPLYASLLLLAWGAFLKDASIPGVLLALAATAFLFITAKVEESENLGRFGASYADYIRRTKRFVPFVL